jgi:O-antigen biosynthesis protein WbqP
MQRILDIALAIAGLSLGAPVLMVVLVVAWFDTGSPLFRQVRLGRDRQPFVLIKFRSMRVGTASVVSHHADPAAVTRIGRLLRHTKLDELPQLWNVLVGEMSLVGPRPGLPDHHELTEARSRLGVFSVRPGITGLAQLRGVDMSDPERLAKVDAEMISDMRVSRYVGFIIATAVGRGSGDRVR